MANRGGLKLREFRTHIHSLKEWQAALETEKLLVVEVFANAFGPCQSILPTINSIMMNLSDSDEKVSWWVVNLHKMYESQLSALEEERKKNADSLSVKKHLRESSQFVRQVSTPRTVPEENKEEASGEYADEQPNGKPNSRGSALLYNAQLADGINVPLLNPYFNYSSSRPKWLFIKDKQIVYELSSANPPKMLKLIDATLNNIALSDAELAAMDHRPKSEHATSRPTSVGLKFKSRVASRRQSPKGSPIAKQSTRKSPTDLINYVEIRCRVSTTTETKYENVQLVCSKEIKDAENNASSFQVVGKSESFSLVSVNEEYVVQSAFTLDEDVASPSYKFAFQKIEDSSSENNTDVVFTYLTRAEVFAKPASEDDDPPPTTKTTVFRKDYNSGDQLGETSSVSATFDWLILGFKDVVDLEIAASDLNVESNPEHNRWCRLIITTSCSPHLPTTVFCSSVLPYVGNFALPNPVQFSIYSIINSAVRFALYEVEEANESSPLNPERLLAETHTKAQSLQNCVKSAFSDFVLTRDGHVLNEGMAVLRIKNLSNDSAFEIDATNESAAPQEETASEPVDVQTLIFDENTPQVTAVYVGNPIKVFCNLSVANIPIKSAPLNPEEDATKDSRCHIVALYLDSQSGMDRKIKETEAASTESSLTFSETIDLPFYPTKDLQIRLAVLTHNNPHSTDVIVDKDNLLGECRFSMSSFVDDIREKLSEQAEDDHVTWKSVVRTADGDNVVNSANDEECTISIRIPKSSVIFTTESLATAEGDQTSAENTNESDESNSKE